MDSWFTVEQIDSETFVISEYEHWEESHVIYCVGQKELFLAFECTGFGGF